MAMRKTGSNLGLWIGLAVAGCMLIGLGCATPLPPRSNAPPQGQAATEHRLNEHYVAMVDNAMLADMSMSSVHFVPHTAELNALGVRRLTRYASLLKIYGGTLRYDGIEPQKELRQSRVERITSFLAAADVKADQFTVKLAEAGGEGMPASEASAIRKATRGPGDVTIQTNYGMAGGGGSGGGSSGK